MSKGQLRKLSFAEGSLFISLATADSFAEIGLGNCAKVWLLTCRTGGFGQSLRRNAFEDQNPSNICFALNSAVHIDCADNANCTGIQMRFIFWFRCHAPPRRRPWQRSEKGTQYDGQKIDGTGSTHCFSAGEFSLITRNDVRKTHP